MSRQRRSIKRANITSNKKTTNHNKKTRTIKATTTKWWWWCMTTVLCFCGRSKLFPSRNSSWGGRALKLISKSSSSLSFGSLSRSSTTRITAVTALSLAVVFPPTKISAVARTLSTTTTAAITTSLSSTSSDSCDSMPPPTGYLNAADAAALDAELMAQPGYTLEQLMELAGLAVAEAIYQVIPPSNDKKKILVICGPGNNGGDGLVAARHLAFFGQYDCVIVYPKRTTKQQHYINLVKQCEDVDIPILDEIPTMEELRSYDGIVDAIFGFSFVGEPREPFASIIRQMMEVQIKQGDDDDDHRPLVISVDVPSGWNVDEGDVAGTGFVPDVLISLTTPKFCAKEFSGRHFIGGRFLPPTMAAKYNVQMPPYPGISQVMEVTRQQVEGELRTKAEPSLSPEVTTTTTAGSSSCRGRQPEDLVRQQKQKLRKRIRAAMKDLTKRDIEAQSAMVWERVFELSIYKSAKTVGLFLSMPTSEINTDLILQHSIQNGKEIFVPEVGKNFELCDMELRKVVLDPDSVPLDGMFHKLWPQNKWKIPEPPEDMPVETARPGDLDLVIMPGLGFDRSRNRLGQGKGYYDRFIAKMTKDGHSLPLVAVALRPQLVEGSIPVASYDRQMDMVVLPDEVIAPPSSLSWREEYASYLAEKDTADANSTSAVFTSQQDDKDSYRELNETWEQQYADYCAEKEARLAQEDRKEKNREHSNSRH